MSTEEYPTRPKLSAEVLTKPHVFVFVTNATLSPLEWTDIDSGVGGKC